MQVLLKRVSLAAHTHCWLRRVLVLGHEHRLLLRKNVVMQVEHTLAELHVSQYLILH